MAEAQAPTVEAQTVATRLRALLGSPEWFEMESFWTARVWFTADDYVRLRPLTGSRLRRTLSAIRDLGALWKRVEAAGSGEDVMAELQALLSDEGQDALWQAVGELLHDVVVEWNLQDMAKALGKPLVLENYEPEGFVRFAEGLPLSAVARIIFGIGLHLGGSLLRSSKG